MARPMIDYYFSMTSPWAYIGHATFQRLASQYDFEINYRPVALSRIFPETGGLPLAKRHPSRQTYRFLELQRWRLKRDVALRLRPKFFPMDAALADKCVMALNDAQGDVGAFMGGLFRALFWLEQNGADPEVIGHWLTQCGADAKGILKAAGSDEMAARYAKASEDAIASGVYGSPTFIRDGEIFFGQDRLELLEDALRSGRAGFHSDYQDP
ncbi:MAG: 2-hydroxychromene-2-carboxylate isomerase [Hyphomicrobiales bacterium]|nr:2-hydroxychromene-2-carboxylate isomerase [Hyphomicrobiales bacterium]MDE2113699.1 2-hydroxychromene-2-carboxylate isomerase [Hyphomicrobiales bacterium]